jgi:hypothetical protein
VNKVADYHAEARFPGVIGDKGDLTPPSSGIDRRETHRVRPVLLDLRGKFSFEGFQVVLSTCEFRCAGAEIESDRHLGRLS